MGKRRPIPTLFRPASPSLLRRELLENEVIGCMRTKCGKILTWFLTFSLLAGCGGGSIPVKPEQQTPVPEQTPIPVSPAVSPSLETSSNLEEVSVNELVLRLLENECLQKPNQNVILSPLSIEMALGMAANGAAGDAKAALNTLLGLDAAQLNALLRPWLERKDNTLSIANSMWFNETLHDSVSGTFQDALSTAYQAETGSFQANSDASVQEINAWVKEKTHDKIDTIVNADTLNDTTLGLLINALYFNGKWADPFQEYQVYDGVFHAAGEDEEAELMSETLGTYFETETATGFSKAYRDGYEFIGILPKEEGTPDFSRLDLDAFLNSQTEEYDVQIQIPKFELEYSTSLKQTLSSLGLESLFADHSMDGVLTEEAQSAGLSAWVSDVIHKTYMKMYEEGTEAAAVTAVMMECGAAMPEERETKQVFLDRPFAFLIRDTASGQVIFCGVIQSLK